MGAHRLPVSVVAGSTNASLPPALSFSSARVTNADPSPAYVLAGVFVNIRFNSRCIVLASSLDSTDPNIGFQAVFSALPGPPALV